MLTIMLPEHDDKHAVELHLEHSLVSLSKWESIHEKPFFGREPMSAEETVSYFMICMREDLTRDELEGRVTQEHFETFLTFINSRQTATTFMDDPTTKATRDVVTNELIYYWMITFNIPFDPCENWHVNRLMTLIKICGIKQAKPKKMSRSAQMEQYRRINEQRRRELNTHG